MQDDSTPGGWRRPIPDGTRFAMWTVLRPAVELVPKRRSVYLCRCDCGAEGYVSKDALRNGRSTSCGCGRRNRGAKSHPLYGTWLEMRRRCRNPNHPGYANHGGKGIYVDSRWEDFKQFVTDIGEKPGPGYSINRRDDRGSFSSENCYWGTRAEQANGKRSRSPADPAIAEAPDGYLRAMVLLKRDKTIRAFTFVDAADYETAARHLWSGRVDYDGRVRVVRKKSGRMVQLPRELLGLSPEDPHVVDHVDGDPLNNRRANLRLATGTQNAQNRQGAQRNSSSGIRGVSQVASGRWRARVFINGREHHLGLHDSSEEAGAVAAAFRRRHMEFSEMDR